MARAICLHCGTKKSSPWKKCSQCGYDPNNSKENLVKSVYLSVGRFQALGDQERYSRELDQVALEIRQGHQPVFEEAELERLMKEQALMQSIPASAVWLTLFRFFLPGIVFLILLFALVLLLKNLS